MNHKQKQSKQKATKGSPYEESGSSENKPKKQDLTSLDDLPAFGNKGSMQTNTYDFDDFGDENSDQNNEKSRFSNAERYLEDFENEEKEGFKVEVKKPKKKAQPVSSGKKRNQGKFNKNLHSGGMDDENEEIEEDIPTDREKDFHVQDNIISSLGHQAGITVS